jgi:hypothetical protein
MVRGHFLFLIAIIAAAYFAGAKWPGMAHSTGLV